MKRNWTCPTCRSIFSRKWNLDRHIKSMHQGFQNSLSREAVPNNQRNPEQASDYSALHPALVAMKGVCDFAEMRNRMTDSNTLFNKLNSLQAEVTSLQRQLASSKRSLDDLLSRHWFLPIRSIQGLSGYLCDKCNTFSIKPIFNIGFDMTMPARHRCNESDYNRNYFVQQIPKNIQDPDIWAAQFLVYWMNNYTFIGRNLIAIDLNKTHNSFEHQLNSEIAYQIIGIPDRFHSHTLESILNVPWIDKAITNIGKKMPMSDSEIMDFVTRIKSTYGILRIPMRGTDRLISIMISD